MMAKDVFSGREFGGKKSVIFFKSYFDTFGLSIWLVGDRDWEMNNGVKMTLLV